MGKPTLWILSRELPPRCGGIADYCAGLAARLADRYEVQLASDRQPPSGGPAPTAILLQYAPQMYQRFGFPSDLPPRLAALKQSCGAPLLGVLHELYIPLSLNPGRLAQSLAMRLALRRLLPLCDHLLVTTEARRQELLGRYRLAPERVTSLPVPSNLPLLPLSAAQREEQRRALMARPPRLLGVTFGTLQRAKRLEALIDLFGEIQSALDAELLLLGDCRGDCRRQERLQRQIAERGLEGRVRFYGPAPAEAISRALSSADFYLMLQDDGLSSRSGTAMAALQHSLPLVANRGVGGDAWLEAYPRLFLLRACRLARGEKEELLAFLRRETAAPRAALPFYEARVGSLQREAYQRIIARLSPRGSG